MREDGGNESRTRTTTRTRRETRSLQTGIVVGTATATVKHPSLEGWRMLVVKLLMADGSSSDGEPVLAIDSLGAGPGELVIVTNDGKHTRELVKNDNTPARWSVLGLADEVR